MQMEGRKRGGLGTRLSSMCMLIETVVKIELKSVIGSGVYTFNHVLIR